MGEWTFPALQLGEGPGSLCFAGESGGDSGPGSGLDEELSQGAPSFKGQLALRQGPSAPETPVLRTVCLGQTSHAALGMPVMRAAPAGLILMPTSTISHEATISHEEQNPAKSGDAKGHLWLLQ